MHIEHASHYNYDNATGLWSCTGNYVVYVYNQLRSGPDWFRVSSINDTEWNLTTVKFTEAPFTTFDDAWQRGLELTT